jgi:hypothetical protein
MVTRDCLSARELDVLLQHRQALFELGACRIGCGSIGSEIALGSSTLQFQIEPPESGLPSVNALEEELRQILGREVWVSIVPSIDELIAANPQIRDVDAELLHLVDEARQFLERKADADYSRGIRKYVIGVVGGLALSIGFLIAGGPQNRLIAGGMFAYTVICAGVVTYGIQQSRRFNREAQTGIVEQRSVSPQSLLWSGIALVGISIILVKFSRLALIRQRGNVELLMPGIVFVVGVLITALGGWRLVSPDSTSDANDRDI